MSHPAGYGNIGIGYCIQLVFATVYLIMHPYIVTGWGILPMLWTTRMYISSVSPLPWEISRK